jgi:hypothetical protein
MDIQLIRATVEDAEELLHIQKESFQTEYEGIGRKKPVLMSLERMRVRISYPDGPTTGLSMRIQRRWYMGI